MKKLLKINCLLSILLFYSCEYEAQISNKVSNQSDYRLKVVYNDDRGNNKFIEVETNKTELLVVHDQGLSSVDNYKESKDTLSEFYHLEVFKNDTIKSITDYKKTINWIWGKKNSHNADYTAIVTNDDF